MTLIQSSLIRLIIVTLYLSFQALASDVQDLKCDTLQSLQGSRSGYQKRNNRCEGLYVSEVGGPSLSVISFTLGSLRFELTSGIQLHVWAPMQTRPVNLRAMAIPLKTYYRMDAIVLPGSALVWPVADVLLPENLSAKRIGVFGWRGTEDKKLLVPVRVTTEGLPPARGSPGVPLLTIQPSFDAEKIKWRWASTLGDNCLASRSWQDAISYPVSAGWPVTINLSQLPAGQNCVEVAAQSGNSTGWKNLIIRVELLAQ